MMIKMTKKMRIQRRKKIKKIKIKAGLINQITPLSSFVY